MGSFLFAKILGLENNIYLQTGVIMLIGLLAKTAILITEYAIERRRKGMGIVESAYSAAQVRLRPILMTVLTMIFGMLPLMFSSVRVPMATVRWVRVLWAVWLSGHWHCSLSFRFSTSSLSFCRRKSVNRWKRNQMCRCF